MKNPASVAALSLALAMNLLPLTAVAQTNLFTDNFSDGARSGGSNTSGLTWYGPGTTVPSATTGSMTFANASAGSRSIAAYFAPTNNRVELANEGDSLVLTVNFSVSGATNGANPTQSDFRLGLFDSTLGSGTTRYTADNQDSTSPTNLLTYGGYAMFGNLGSSSGSFSLRERSTSSANKLISTTTPFGSPLSSTTAQPLTLGSNYVATLTLTRTATGVDLIASMTGQGLSNYTVSYSDSTSPYYFFDTIAFGGQFVAGENFTFTNFSLDYTAIPEPSSAAALLGLTAAGLFFLRRRRLAA